MSRLGESSCQESQISTAAWLAVKWAEIHPENEISILTEKLKKLENQRDLEVVEAESNVYAEAESNDVAEGAEVGNTLHESESSIHTNKLNCENPQTASTLIQTKTELNVREDSLMQEHSRNPY